MYAWALVSSVVLKVLKVVQLVGAVGIVSVGAAVVVVGDGVEVLAAVVVLAPVAKVYW